MVLVVDIAYNLPIEGLIDETGTVPSKIFKNLIVLIVNNRISLKEMVSTILCWYYIPYICIFCYIYDFKVLDRCEKNGWLMDWLQVLMPEDKKHHSTTHNLDMDFPHLG